MIDIDKMSKDDFVEITPEHLEIAKTIKEQKECRLPVYIKCSECPIGSSNLKNGENCRVNFGHFKNGKRLRYIDKYIQIAEEVLKMDKKKREFKVGDKVKFRKDLVIDEMYGEVTFLDNMKKELEKANYTDTIVKVIDLGCFETENLYFIYSQEMLEDNLIEVELKENVVSENKYFGKDIKVLKSEDRFYTINIIRNGRTIGRLYVGDKDLTIEEANERLALDGFKLVELEEPILDINDIRGSLLELAKEEKQYLDWEDEFQAKYFPQYFPLTKTWIKCRTTAVASSYNTREGICDKVLEFLNNNNIKPDEVF